MASRDRAAVALFDSRIVLWTHFLTAGSRCGRARVVTVEVEAASDSFVDAGRGDPSDVRPDPDTRALFAVEFRKANDQP